MNNNKNTPDLSKKITGPVKQIDEIMKPDPKTTLPEKTKRVPNKKMIELEDWINLKPQVILNRLPEKNPKKHIDSSLNSSKTHDMNKECKEKNKDLKTPTKRKVLEKNVYEDIDNSPKKQLKEPKIILKKLPDRYINELIQKRKKAINLNEMNVVLKRILINE